MSGVRVVTATLLAVAVTAGIVAAHQQVSESGLGTYKALVMAYRAGDDSSADRLHALDARVLPDIIATLRAEEPFFLRENIRAACMLHADAALAAVSGRSGGDWWFHMDLASQLLQWAGPEAQPFTRRWYLTISRHLREIGWQLAERLLEAGRRRLPGDPVVFYESAHLQEAVAADSAIQALDFPGRAFPTVASAAGRRRMARLNAAAGWLRDALKADPSHAMARLHLGRVQMLRGDEDEALRLLTAFPAGSDDPASMYLAALFAGATCERRGRLDDAAASYRLAIQHWPSGYAGRLALSHVLRVAGKGDGARDQLERLFDQTADPRGEPWWWYLVEPPGIARERLEALRRMVRE